VYLQKGDNFGANDINEMNRMANQMDKAAGEVLTMADDIDTLQEDVEFLVNDVPLIKDTLGYTYNPSSKNLLENTGTSETVNGVTRTVNDDMSITLNGKATTSCYFTINTKCYLPNGEYILSGCPQGGSSDTYHISLKIGGSEVITDVGEGANFVVNGNLSSIGSFSMSFSNP
jgi:hypothetical protein